MKKLIWLIIIFNFLSFSQNISDYIKVNNFVLPENLKNLSILEDLYKIEKVNNNILNKLNELNVPSAEISNSKEVEIKKLKDFLEDVRSFYTNPIYWQFSIQDDKIVFLDEKKLSNLKLNINLLTQLNKDIIDIQLFFKALFRKLQTIVISLKNGKKNINLKEYVYPKYFFDNTTDREFSFKFIQKELKKLNMRISINNMKGYKMAVIRDNIKIDYYDWFSKLENFLLKFPVILASTDKIKDDVNQFTDLFLYNIENLPKDDKILEKISTKNLTNGILKLLINFQLNVLSYVNTSYKSYLKTNFPKNSSIAEKALENLKILRARILAIEELVQLSFFNIDDILNPNPSILDLFDLQILKKYINSFEISKNLNSYLEQFYVNVASILFAVVFLILGLMLVRVFYEVVFNFVCDLVFSAFSEKTKNYLSSSIKTPLKEFLLIYIWYEALLILFENPPLKISRFLYKGFLILTTLIFIKLLLNFIDNWVYDFSEYYLQKKKIIRKELLNITVKISKILVWIVGILILLNFAGFNITAVLTSLGIGGLAVALAAKDTLSNFFGSINILMDNAFSQGDWIVAGDIEGTVVEIGLRATTIRTFENALVTVPNSNLAGQAIINWSKRKVGRRIKFHVQVLYSSQIEQLRKTINDIRKMLYEHPDIATPRLKFEELSRAKINKLLAKEDELGIKNNLFVYLDRLNDSSIDILVYCFTKTTDWERWLQIKEDIIMKVIDIVRSNGLEFAFPSQSIYFETPVKIEK